MKPWRLISFFQACLALILLGRVFWFSLTSVRGMLLFGLLPTIVSPLVFLPSRFAIDYHVQWLELKVLEWLCLVGVTYALLTGLFSALPGLLQIFRRVWAVALVTSFLVAIFTGR
ncbi:MAG: hypothetical protein ACJ746_16100 [Bryobacteraceae bacterium]